MISVLYVDDEKVLLDLTRVFLEREGELNVDTAESAAEGLRKIKESPIDIIVSDYQMPDMDGIAFLKEVRKQFGDIPFILFTGRGREEVVIEAINNGVDFYIQKGGDPKAQFAELAHKIRQAVTRQKAELLRIESEKRLADIINFLPDATFAIDRDGCVIAWNRAIEEMTGIPSKEMLGKGNYEYSLPFYGTRRKILIDLVFEPNEIIEKNYTHIFHEKDILIADTTLPRPRGMKATLMGKASPLYNSSGDIVGAIESIRDISERQRTEDELRVAYERIAANEEELRDQLDKLTSNQAALNESERRFRELADLLPQGIYESDLSGRIMYGNRLALEMFGYSAEDLRRGLNAFSVIAPVDRERAITIFRRVIETGAPIKRDEDYSGLCKDGTTFPVSIFSSPIIRDGKVIGMRGVIIDISERKKNEEYLIAMNEQLASAGEQLRAQYEALARNEQQISESEKRLSYMLGFYEMSHKPEKDLLSYAIEGAGAVTASPLGYLAFLNDDETELTMYAWSRTAMEECSTREKPIIYPVAKTGLWGEAVRQRRPVITNDYQAPNPAKKGYPEGHPHIIRHMNVPIMDGEHIVMVAGVANKPSDYSQFDIQGLTLLMQGLWQVLLRRRTEEELRHQCDALANSELRVRESEEHYRTIIDNIQDIVYRSDAAGNLTMINPSFVIKLGYGSAEECIGKNIADHFWFYPEKRKEFLEELMKSGSVTDYEVLLKKRDGTPLPVSTSTHLYYNRDGTIAGVEGIFHDITAIRDAQEQIQMLANLNDTSPASIVVHTPGGEILYANERTYQMHGWTREEFMALNLHQLDVPDSEQKIQERVEMLRTRGEVSFDVEHYRKDGTKLPLHVTARLTRWKDREVILSVSTDITERKNAENAVREANRKLNLLSSITRHDVANQLMILVGLLEVASMKESDPEISDLLTKMNTTALTIRHQIDFTGTYQDLGIHTPGWFRLDEIIEGAGYREIQLSQNCRNIEIFADPMFNRVFMNLFENAIRHGNRVNRITVDCSHTPDRLLVIIEDNGVGIPPGEKEKIFEKGYGNHTGFGLFLAREILAITGCTIREAGVHGTGARFEITVPKGNFRFSVGSVE